MRWLDNDGDDVTLVLPTMVDRLGAVRPIKAGRIADGKGVFENWAVIRVIVIYSSEIIIRTPSAPERGL